LRESNEIYELHNLFFIENNNNIRVGIHLVAGASVAAFFLAFFVRIALLRFNIIDRPNSRSSHSIPTVRGGGLAILGAFLAIIIANSQHTRNVTLLISATMLVGGVSFWDDLRSISPSIRLFVQTIAAALAIYGIRLGHSLGWPADIFANIFGFFWIVGYTNAFNFMDGINGLAGVQGITTGLGTALIGIRAGATVVEPAVVVAFALAGASAGFLPHNFPRARMFLGDVGSASMGFLLSVAALWIALDHGAWLLVALGLIHANFILDTSITLVRRVLRSERCFEAHREHFYQRLVRSGKSHSFTTALNAFLQVLVVFAVLASLDSGRMVRAATGVGICVIWIGVFAYSDRCFRKSLSEL
jgi:UDP-N-acetylmuramyl pentapeptide phosphotransferase/UDP-N-acetylglucosamine-1-phosphate transferase